MKSWKAIVGITAVFLLGVLAGGLLTAGIIRHRFRHRGDVIVRRLSSKLDLDETQREQLRVIVTDAEEQIRVLRQQVQPQVETVLTQAEAKVRLILTPDQIEKFNKIVAERHAKWRTDAPPPPPPSQ
jgi:Spy/CpxP family protein refolding chaperone